MTQLVYAIAISIFAATLATPLWFLMMDTAARLPWAP
jgi:hypothetical protein